LENKNRSQSRLPMVRKILEKNLEFVPAVFGTDGYRNSRDSNGWQWFRLAILGPASSAGLLETKGVPGASSSTLPTSAEGALTARAKTLFVRSP
jgi:hypothetical protein